MNKVLIILSGVIMCAMAIIPLDRGPPISNSKLSKLIQESTANKQMNYRLSHNTAPRVYLIEFDPDFMGESFTFKGNSSIIFEVLRSTPTVILHRSHKITIDKDFTELVDKNEESFKPESQIWHAHNESYAISFQKILEPGNYTLKMKWTGRDAAEDWFNQRMGFFRAVDRISPFNKKYLVTTHFEPSGARSAFPCWDEPGFKAQFEISVKHYPNYTALSNMPEKSRQLLPDGRIITHFERSLKMSPYLPCVAVADYQAIKNQHGNITFYSLENNLDSLKFALEISEKVIPAMEAYTDMPYAMPKLDQITIPKYNGAMEHWGLVTYKRTFGLFIPEGEKILMEKLIAEEIGWRNLAHTYEQNIIHGELKTKVLKYDDKSITYYDFIMSCFDDRRSRLIVKNKSLMDAFENTFQNPKDYFTQLRENVNRDNTGISVEADYFFFRKQISNRIKQTLRIVEQLEALKRVENLRKAIPLSYELKTLGDNLAHMTEQAKKAMNQLEKKVKILTGGYQTRTQVLSKQHDDFWDQIQQAHLELLKIQEEVAIIQRIDSLTNDVNKQIASEKNLQDSFVNLQDQLQKLNTRMVKFENSTLIPNIEQKDRILFLVAHELAHQWFGNLVSPVWWDDTWLNEGFAAYFQSKIIDQIYPQWHIMDHFVIENVNHDSYDSESYLPQAKPIKWNPPGKIALRMVFNPVTYRKGAAVIHMLEHILTEEVFREGLQGYFKAHQFDSVVTNDLWRAFQEVYNKKHEDKPLNIKETMDPWIEQTGTPVVNVTRNYETGEITLIQKNSRNQNPKNKWRIPINFATKSNPEFSCTTPTMWMEVDQEVTTISDVMMDDWIIVNIQQRGFYQVNYDKENWKLIADYLNSENYTKIHVVNRAQLFDDIFRLYSTDKSYLEILVNITSYLHQETDYLPWIPAAAVIMEMQEHMRNTLEEESFETYMLYLTNAVMDKLGFENREDDDHSAIKIRSILAPIVCSFGHAECKLFAKRLLKKYLEDPSKNTLPTSDWEWIVCNGLRTANESLREEFMASKYDEYDELSKLRILIECTNDFQLKEEYLSSLTTANSTVDAEHVDKILSRLLERKLDDVNFVLNYFIDHFNHLKKLYDEIEDYEYLIPISRIALAIRTQDQYEKFKQFVESIVVPDLKGKSDSQGSTLLLQTSLKESLSSINQSKLHSAKFHELMDKKFFEPNVIEIGQGLKN